MTIVSTEPTQVPDGRVPVSDIDPIPMRLSSSPGTRRAGSRFYGAANRDSRKFQDSERIRRNARRSGPTRVRLGTACVGMHLAPLEMAATFRALATRMKGFHIESEIRAINNILRGFSKLIVSVE